MWPVDVLTVIDRRTGERQVSKVRKIGWMLIAAGIGMGAAALVALGSGAPFGSLGLGLALFLGLLASPLIYAELHR